MGSLFDGYALGAAWDEMFGPDGRARRPTPGCFALMSPSTAG